MKHEIAATEKEIGTCNNMVVKHFKSRAIVGDWYPIVSIDFHEHVMTSMMVVRRVYALVVVLPTRVGLVSPPSEIKILYAFHF